ncbi:MAG: DUF4833 domain-containing protein [Chitinophagia bacterium]
MNFTSNILNNRKFIPSLSSIGLGILFFFIQFQGNAASINFSKDVDSFPVPKGNPLQLFYLQRTANTNTIICELNTNAKGQPIPEKPVNVYWIVYTEGGAKKELNYIQRNFAYGIDAKSAENGSYKLHFVSYKKRVFDLKWNPAANKYQVFATINNKEAILHKIFVKVEGGSFWVPNIVYVEFRGTDPTTGKEVFERFKP